MRSAFDLAQLDRRERLAIVLYFNLGLRDPEIADVFEVSRQRAQQLRYRAQKKLRRVLA